MNHAETLIKVTEEYTLRPRKGDRVNVCIAVLEIKKHKLECMKVTKRNLGWVFLLT